MQTSLPISAHKVQLKHDKENPKTCSSGVEITGGNTAESGTVSTAGLLDKYAASKEEALLTGCRPCGYILKRILCLSLQCKGPLAGGFECAHDHAGVSKEG